MSTAPWTGKRAEAVSQFDGVAHLTQHSTETKENPALSPARTHLVVMLVMVVWGVGVSRWVPQLCSGCGGGPSVVMHTLHAQEARVCFLKLF